MNWISVEDKLPQKLQKVLFHWVTHGHLRNVSMGYMCDAGWNIYLPYHSFGLRHDVCPVTHWMKLPEFPKKTDSSCQIGTKSVTDSTYFTMPPSPRCPYCGDYSSDLESHKCGIIKNELDKRK